MGLRDLLFNEPAPPAKTAAPKPNVVDQPHLNRAPVVVNGTATGSLKKRVIPPSGPLAAFLSITTSLAKFIPGIPERTAAALETLINQGSSKEMLTLNIEDAKDNLAAERSKFQQVISLRTENEVNARRAQADAIGADLSRKREEIAKLEAEQAGLRAAANDAATSIAAGFEEFNAAADSVAAELEEIRSQI